MTNHHTDLSMGLQAIIDRTSVPTPWSEGDNIPWDEPGFSGRMLEVHLSQESDLASRRYSTIDAHVAFIQAQLGGTKGARVLDMACGPGLYLHRLCGLGHQGIGIDFSPASVAHAQEVARKESLSCEFNCADLRQAELGREFDLALLVYGQINVFPRVQAQELLRRACRALKPGGMLILEPQSFATVRGTGSTVLDWSSAEKGLFSPRPHILLHERFWDEGERTTTDRWHVVACENGEVTRHAMSTCAYEPHEMIQMLGGAGFCDVALHPSLSGEGVPPSSSSAEAFFALVARSRAKSA